MISSPAQSILRSASVIADIPLEQAIQALPPSSSFNLVSKAATVGFPTRLYAKPAALCWKTLACSSAVGKENAVTCAIGGTVAPSAYRFTALPCSNLVLNFIAPPFVIFPLFYYD